MTIPVANLYYLLCYAWRHVKEADIVRREELEGLDGTHHLLGKVLAEGTFRLLRRGIDRGYMEVREDLAGIRGKLVIGETAKRALRARGRAACEFEELSHDVLHNRILRSTLADLLKLSDLHRDVRADVRTAYGKLHGVSLMRLERGLFRQVQLDRNRYVYRFLMSICELIRDCLIVKEKSGTTRFRDLRKDEYRMGKVFEDFAIEFYRREQREFRVNHPSRAIQWDANGTRDDQSRMIPRMEADLILESENRRIILDTKYCQPALSSWRGSSSKLRSDHLYQLLAYLRNREAMLKLKPGPKHEGILLYPVVDKPLAVDVRLEGFDIRARGIDLGSEWRKIHDGMLDVISL